LSIRDKWEGFKNKIGKKKDLVVKMIKNRILGIALIKFNRKSQLII
jgi:hypothetical protein